jgi:thioredoxin 1
MPVLDDKNFERDVKSGVVVVNFYSLWNMDSRALELPFRQLSDEFRGRAKFMLSEINANAPLAKNEGITKIPTIAIYLNGTPVLRMNNTSKRQLKESIEYFLRKME